MTEKTLELLDLLFTFILIGSLIRQIPAVDKALVSVENILDYGSKALPRKTDHEWILWTSKVFGFIAIFFFVLIIVLSHIRVNFDIDIPPKFYFSLLFICCTFTYLWMAMNVAKPTKIQILNHIKSNVWLFLAPFLFLAFDLLFDLNILETFSQGFFNLILNIFGYQIPNNLFANFLAVALIFYVSMTFQFILMWLISQPPYLAALMLLKIIKHPQKQERFLFLILLAFMINKLFIILVF